MQDATETMTLNQLAGCTHTFVSSDTPARTHVVRQYLSDIKHGSSEIQLQSAKSSIDDSSCCHTISSEPKQSQTAAPLVSKNNTMDSDADGSERGIELQEQGHAEMLEHVLGDQLCVRNVSAEAYLRSLTCCPACFLGCYRHLDLGSYT